jgi:thiamine-phosphate pyrophosphorylase
MIHFKEKQLMKFTKHQLLLYAITDRMWIQNRTLEEVVQKTILGGATMIQLREKNLPLKDFIHLSSSIQEITKKYNIPLLINDNVEVALAVDADGIHVGQEDVPAKEIRQIIGNDKILGVSAQTIPQALQAIGDGADYLGVGSIFSTPTKKDAENVSIETLCSICQKSSVPVVAIGGINENNALELVDTNISGIAVVSAIFAAPDPHEATKTMRKLAQRIVQV